jgi:hypothetical protein
VIDGWFLEDAYLGLLKLWITSFFFWLFFVRFAVLLDYGYTPAFDIIVLRSIRSARFEFLCDKIASSLLGNSLLLSMPLFRFRCDMPFFEDDYCPRIEDNAVAFIKFGMPELLTGGALSLSSGCSSRCVVIWISSC